MNAHQDRAAVEREAIAVALRTAMVAQLKTRGVLRTASVIAAFSVVAREMFAPDSPLGEMYDRDHVVITQRDEDGVVSGSMAAPRIQALMLELADIRPGMRVLEIGTDGYTAALIAELVGPDGEATTLDTDSAVADRAAVCLAAAGYPRVRVLCRPAEGGVPEHAPFDRIIVTAVAGDLPPAWGEQLVEGGVLVVPLRLRGLIRSVALLREDGRLRDCGQVECGRLVSILGHGPERLIPLDEEVTLRLDGAQNGQAGLNVDALRDALTSPRVVRRSGVRVGGSESLADLDLFLATKLDGFGLLEAGTDAIEAGLVENATREGATTAVTATSFAYRTPQPTSARRDLSELVVYGHGPDAKTLAASYVALIREWDRRHRRGRGARIEVFPVGSPEAEMADVVGASRVIDNKHTRVLISWPPTS